MRARNTAWLTLALSCLFGWTWAGSGRVQPSAPIVLAGGESVVWVALDFGAGGVGSYGSSLTWDPASLRLLAAAGGDPPFDDPVINADDAALGILRFADAVPGGASGRVVVLRATFDTLVGPPATAAIDLEFTSAFGSEAFEDMLPDLAVTDATACVPDHRWRLNLRDAAATVVDWNAIPGAVAYDVVRGILEDLRQNPGQALLAVDCLEQGSTDTTTEAGNESGNPDTETPLPAHGFYYLARFNDGTTDGSYGFVDSCATERIVTTGDCSPARK